MIVLDASAVAQIVFGSREGDALREFMLEGEKSIAPDLVRSELANVFWKYHQAGMLERKDAQVRLSEAISLIDEIHPSDDLVVEAFNEAVRLNRSAYDMLYLVLARRTGSTLFTLDKELQEACLETGVDCVTSTRL